MVHELCFRRPDERRADVTDYGARSGRGESVTPDFFPLTPSPRQGR